ncbi:MAG: ABC transporter permease subunit, partial [Verrucomicrobiota bacterium]|nr:ABC transporter permease subunit [Verrucomicrobiota bacterium]
ISQNVEAADWLPVGKEGAPILGIDVGDAGDSKLIGVIQQVGDHSEVHAVGLTRKRTLLGGGKLAVEASYDLTAQLTGKPVEIHINSAADSVVIVTADGEVQYLFKSGEQFERRQVFKPFGDLADPTVAAIDFLFGDVSLVTTSITGRNRVFSLYRQEGSDVRTFGQTKEFEPLPGAATFYTSSLRNKGFLTGTAETASLRYSTTETVRWQQKMPFTIAKAVISGKYERLLFLDKDHRLHLYSLHDPHAETSWKGLFGKVWYEGYGAPSYEWQSTGGSDEFEPKFSLVPLIVGTLKGTLYALLFAVPIALTAALYASQFLHARFRAVVKPTMEIMASLPSVVLGFLAALWIAPLIETRVPSILLMAAGIPLAAFVFGYLWSGLPFRYRQFIKPGYEFIVFLPLVALIAWGCWKLGPTFEKLAFVVTDPATGAKVADFRQWWPHVTGADYQQRNSLVVGFVMGFAVIPIIFTIAEDALSNVPMNLRSASLALGATRWVTALRIVVPTASAGIFSALMIGLGRAVGETMIVVMATGNTPIMDLNIFSGMRTLSANIAVELPEAPVNGTLYRTLFLGAMLLFLATFVVNTVAEVLRQRLREKYKTA